MKIWEGENCLRQDALAVHAAHQALRHASLNALIRDQTRSEYNDCMTGRTFGTNTLHGVCLTRFQVRNMLWSTLAMSPENTHYELEETAENRHSAQQRASNPPRCPRSSEGPNCLERLVLTDRILFFSSPGILVFPGTSLKGPGILVFRLDGELRACCSWFIQN